MCPLPCRSGRRETAPAVTNAFSSRLQTSAAPSRADAKPVASDYARSRFTTLPPPHIHPSTSALESPSPRARPHGCLRFSAQLARLSAPCGRLPSCRMFPERFYLSIGGAAAPPSASPFPAFGLCVFPCLGAFFFFFLVFLAWLFASCWHPPGGCAAAARENLVRLAAELMQPGLLLITAEQMLRR